MTTTTTTAAALRAPARAAAVASSRARARASPARATTARRGVDRSPPQKISPDASSALRRRRSSAATVNRGGLCVTSAGVEPNNRAGKIADPPAPSDGFGVVITGATKGVGFAIAREFLRRGDRVCICGRAQTRVDAAVAALRHEFPGSCVSGMKCDVTDPRDVDAFGDYAASTVGVIHHWLNNAGMVSSREPLMDLEPSEVVRVCNTNLTGAILCCQKAVRVMRRQPKGSDSAPAYHVYNFGFSRWGASFSKSTCTHKATKRGLSQLTASLSEELKEAGVHAVGIHQLSPGMVLTDLLLDGASPVARRFFNVLAEEPEVVAADLAPKIRAVEGTNTSIEFLSLPGAVSRVLTGVPAILGGGRFFDANGNRVKADEEKYKPNGTRLLYDGME